MKRNGIDNPYQLAPVIRMARSTVYEAFKTDWSGIATTTLMAALASTFNAPLGSLVTLPEPKVRKPGTAS